MPHITPVHHRPILYGIEPAPIDAGPVNYHGIVYGALVRHVTKTLAIALYFTPSVHFARALKSNISEPTAIAHRAINTGTPIPDMLIREFFPNTHAKSLHADPGVAP